MISFASHLADFILNKSISFLFALSFVINNILLIIISYSLDCNSIFMVYSEETGPSYNLLVLVAEFRVHCIFVVLCCQMKFSTVVRPKEAPLFPVN